MLESVRDFNRLLKPGKDLEIFNTQNVVIFRFLAGAN